MELLKFNFENSGITKEELEGYQERITSIVNELESKKDIEEEFLGWLDLPVNYDKEEFKRIEEAAKKIRSDSEILLVIGIGGSYLGARAVIEALSNSFYTLKENRPLILYAGNNLSTDYIEELLEILKNKDFSINVISKSGTTTEPAIAFRIFKKLLEDKYGSKAASRIYVTTDSKKGALKKLAEKENYETFVIPDSVGGRYSVLTAVGLLPIEAAGISTKKLIEGAAFAREQFSKMNIEENPCYQYAVARNILYKKGKEIEILVNYEPKMYYLTEWWKQLFGESEGKEEKGLFPAGVQFTTDLHSMGQYIQEGKRNLIETVIEIKKPKYEIKIAEDKENLDGLNYLTGKTLDYINKQAMQGTIDAHVAGSVPNMKITINEITEEQIGMLLYFFEKSCAISGKILGVNPFNQPGVEKYKTNMFKLLEKPGY